MGCPPHTGCDWSAQRLAQLDAIIAGYARFPRWAFKDPRTLYTLEGWLERLPEMRFIASFRHPMAVARSLLLRAGGGDLDRYIALWTAYNRRLIECHDRFGFELVCFDLAPTAYLEQVRACARRLGLEPGALTFFDPGLRNQGEAERHRLPPGTEGLYRALKERASR